MKGVCDCVTTVERIQMRLAALHDEIRQLCRNPCDESVAQADVLTARSSRLVQHARQVQDIQAAWAK